MASNIKILFLGPNSSPIPSWLSEQKENVFSHSDKISPEFLETNKIDFIISHGYRHIIKEEILAKLPNKIINLHISLLPWNRGADPNLWSFIDNTPKGVTIHFIDKGIDTGDILTQREIKFDASSETLSSSYQKLQDEIFLLFKENWEAIKEGKLKPIKQSGTGTHHKTADKKQFENRLTKGWDTPVSTLLSN